MLIVQDSIWPIGFQPYIRSVFLMRKTSGEILAIGWHARWMVISPPLDFCFTEMLCIMGFSYCVLFDQTVSLPKNLYHIFFNQGTIKLLAYVSQYILVFRTKCHRVCIFHIHVHCLFRRYIILIGTFLRPVSGCHKNNYSARSLIAE